MFISNVGWCLIIHRNQRVPTTWMRHVLQWIIYKKNGIFFKGTHLIDNIDWLLTKWAMYLINKWFRIPQFMFYLSSSSLDILYCNPSNIIIFLQIPLTEPYNLVPVVHQHLMLFDPMSGPLPCGYWNHDTYWSVHHYIQGENNRSSYDLHHLLQHYKLHHPIGYKDSMFWLHSMTYFYLDRHFIWIDIFFIVAQPLEIPFLDYIEINTIKNHKELSITLTFMSIMGTSSIVWRHS